MPSAARSSAALLSIALALYAAADAGAQTTRVWTPGAQGDLSDSTKYNNGAPVNGDSVTADGPDSIINYGASDNYTLVALSLNPSTATTTFNQSGGTLSLTNLSFGGGGGSRNPIYNLTDGTLNISTGFTWGNGNAAQFKYSGGSVNYAGGGFYSVGVAGGANGTIEGSGTGVFNADSATALRLGSSNGGTGNLTLSGAAIFSANGTGTAYLGNNGGNGNVTMGGTSQLNAPNMVLSIGQFSNTAGRGGKVTMTGGTMRFQRIAVGGDNAGSVVTGTIDMTGGVIETAQIRRGASTVASDANANYLKVSGGTIRVTPDATRNADFFADGLYVELGANGLTVDTNGNDTGFSNALTGAGGLTKIGGGTLSLTGANSYAGPTTVTAGTLRLGADEVLADASTLRLNGGTVIADGGTELVGLLDIAADSVLQFGALDAVAHILTFADVAGGGTLSVTNWSQDVDQFLFTTLADAEAVAAVTTFVDPNGASGSFGGMVVASGDNFAVVAIPEPASLALLGLGGLVVASRRKG